MNNISEVVGGEGVSAPSLTGRILITGGAGFIGRAIIKRAHEQNWDARFTIFSRDEQKQHAVVERWPDVRCVLGDIRDGQRLKDIFYGHDTIIHAAALKYIPEAEFNVSECIDINLVGSNNVIHAAQGVCDRVVALSTDKAVSPLNVYGATKMLMERVFVEADLLSPKTRYTVVRYGNVIGSTGSALPMFRKQAQQSGVLTLTDPDMTRFWVTYNEAVDLICEAATCDERGVTVVPDAAAASLEMVADVSHADIPDVEHRVLGRRPGEKLHEALINESESVRTIVQNGFYYILPQGRSGNGEPFELSSDNAKQLTAVALGSAFVLSEDV